MDKALKPCPFCGSEELDIWQNDVDNYFVVCIGCGASGRDERRVEKAVEVWNRRLGDHLTFCYECRWFETGWCNLHKEKTRPRDYCSGSWRR